MAIATYNDIISARASGNYWDWFESSTTAIGGVTISWYTTALLTTTAGRGALTFTSLSAGGAIMNAASTGALPIPFIAGTSRYLASMGLNVSNIAGFTSAMLVDYLWTGANINWATSANTTVTATGAPALTRYGGLSSAATQPAVGNQILIDITVALAGTPGSIIINYLDSNGVAKATPTITPATAAANRNWANTTGASPFITLQDSAGVSKIVSVVLGAGTTPTGAFNVSIVRPILLMPLVAANMYVERDSTINFEGLVELENGTDNQHGCLQWLFLTNSTATALYTALGRTISG